MTPGAPATFAHHGQQTAIGLISEVDFPRELS
jgi:hypothetical protein